MRLTKEELAKHNAKALKIAELKCNTTLPGVAINAPDYISNLGWTNVQLALPCGIIREQKRKVNAMQVRTGSYTTSLAKEKTKFDDQLGSDYDDPTDYISYNIEEDDLPVIDNVTSTNKQPIPSTEHATILKKGILDL